MSFETLKKDELLAIAEQFGVETKPTDTKAVIVAALAEDGVTWESAAALDPGVAAADEVLKQEAAATKEKGPKALLKMVRENRTYEIRGIKFTRDHPFALVPEEDAEWITDNVEGFSYATPREAEAYYG